MSMKKLMTFNRNLLLLLGFTIFGLNANAQTCTMKYSAKEGCIPFSIKFSVSLTGGKIVKSYSWDFKDGNNSTDSAPAKIYSTAGSYVPTVKIIFTDNTFCIATAADTIHAYGLPTAVIGLPTKKIQCFQGNMFDFKSNSKLSADGWPIVKYIWLFGDGDSSTQQNPSHHYDADGTYTVSLTVQDSKGCRHIEQKVLAIKVLADIVPVFTTSGTAGCNVSCYTFTNKTDTAGILLDSFFWDFGDGTWDSSQTKWTGFKHCYTTSGPFTPRLIIKNSLDCYGQKTGNSLQNTVNKLAVFYKDTICWSEATSVGVKFKANPIAGAYYWNWNFGDPPSGPKNNAPFQYSASHQFVSGPKNYEVTFTAYTVDCGTIDTCIVLHVEGPQARTTLPKPPYPPVNTYIPSTPRSKADFLKVKNGNGCTSPDTLQYSTYTQNGTKDYKIYKYCNADTATVVWDTAKYCDGNKQRYVKSVTWKPTDSVTITVKDSIETKFIFTKSDAIPAVPYYQSKGSYFVHTKVPDGYLVKPLSLGMHDTDHYSCTPWNLVFFPNHSIKYRLWKAADDQYPNKNPDTCLDKNYPYSSDSMTYFWTFRDPTGKPCTSTYKNPSWDCNYSTEAVPYHFYKNTKPPASRCYFPQMTVKDTWKDNYGQIKYCADSTTVILGAGPPTAKWDTTAYCKMTWEIQKYLPNSPRRGFRLTNQPLSCAGYAYKHRYDISELLPCESAVQDYWIEFDSAKNVKKKCSYTHLVGGNFVTDSLLTYNWMPKKVLTAPPYSHNWWYNQGDFGCKTIGVVLKVNDCYDTAWYHDYICIKKLLANFCAYIGKDTIPDSTHLIHKPAWCSGQVVHMCPDSFGLKPTRFKVVPADQKMDFITQFKYTLERKEVPNNGVVGTGQDFYYAKPFWPDSATLDPLFQTWTDSINAKKDTVFIPKDSSIYVKLYDRSGNFVDSAFMSGFYITPKELTELNSFYKTHLVEADMRGRQVDFDCSAKGVDIYLNKNKWPIKVKDSIFFLDLYDPITDKPRSHDTVTFTLPYPGFYYMNAFATNIDGCSDGSIAKIINGHYATFWADDSIVCVGEPVNFHQKVRYWTVDYCNPLVEECLWEQLNAWDTSGLINQTNLRKAVIAGYANPNLKFYFEFLPRWSFGDGSPDVSGKAPTHKYAKAGVYTVTMTTTDSLKCALKTQRKKFIKVVDLNAAFTVTPLSDTLTFCAPKIITFVDQSNISMTQYSKGRYARYIDRVKKTFPANPPAHLVPFDSIVYDTLIVDSILYRKWNIGDGRDTIKKVNSDTLRFEYVTNGVYTVSLKIKSVQCEDEIIKKKYIRIQGPIPVFKPLDTTGCAPLLVKVKVDYIRARVYNFDKGDGTFQAFGRDSAKDSFLYLNYTKPGKFALQIREEDSVYDPYFDTLYNCVALWPDTIRNPSLPRYHITVYPHDTFHIAGDTLICINETATFTAKAPSYYNKYDWDYGNGQTSSGTSATGTTVYTKPGRFLVKCLGYTDHDCQEAAYMYITVQDVKADFDTIRDPNNPALFQFINKSKSAVTFKWTFGDPANTSRTSSDSLQTESYDYSDFMPNDGDSSRTNIDEFNFNVCLIAYNSAGCPDTACKIVTVKRVWETYNVFTPNNDGINDVFDLKIENDVSYHLQIFNRWGEKVFESKDKNVDWNGKVNNTGKDCAPGSYFWIWDFQVIGLDKVYKKDFRKYGGVTLIR